MSGKASKCGRRLLWASADLIWTDLLFVSDGNLSSRTGLVLFLIDSEPTLIAMAPTVMLLGMLLG
jgi:hypothetical protein